LRPSAWHRYVAQIDPDLPPDFALANLRRSQWRNPHLPRLLFLGFGLYPLWTGIVIGVVLGIAKLSGIPIVSIVLGISYGISLTLVGGMMGAITIAVPFALMASVISGIVLGIWVGISGYFGGDIVTISVGIFALSLAGNINSTPKIRARYALHS